jgi:hypothetical protein
MGSRESCVEVREMRLAKGRRRVRVGCCREAPACKSLRGVRSHEEMDESGEEAVRLNEAEWLMKGEGRGLL